MTDVVMIGRVPHAVPEFGQIELPSGGGLLIPVPGRDGRGVELMGTVDTYAALADLVCSPALAGKGWVVLADGLAYFCDGEKFPPEGKGVQLKGDKGDKGDKGAPGRGISGVSVGPDSTLIFDWTEGGPQGVTVPSLEAAKAAAEAAERFRDEAQTFEAAAGHEADRAAHSVVEAQTALTSAQVQAGLSEGAAERSEAAAKKAEDLVSDGIPKADAATAGVIKLPGTDAGSLGGTFDNPRVVGWDKVFQMPEHGIDRFHMSESVNVALEKIENLKASDIGDATDIGQKLLTADNESAARIALGVDPSNILGKVSGLDVKGTGGRSLKLWLGTEAEYNALASKTDPNTIYFKFADAFAPPGPVDTEAPEVSPPGPPLEV